ncbi:MAG: DNA alkylation repair protein [Verrucomicrobiales bacterium]|nr:DNA alkylation repair protein [Verrucomicrobiales bacterium]
MTVKQILAELKSLGTVQTRKTFARHGITGDYYGVRYGDLEKLAKRLKRERESALAAGLWESGNHDAMVLATKIADPASLTKRQAEAWVRDVKNRLEVCAIAALVGQMEFAPDLADKWITASPARSEWKVISGWTLIADIAMNQKQHADVKVAWFRGHLKTIQSEIHEAINWVRYEMNGALIAIGSRNEALRKSAEAAANRIGKVDVDHGDTSCKTPDAIPYLEKVWARKKK